VKRSCLLCWRSTLRVASTALCDVAVTKRCRRTRTFDLRLGEQQATERRSWQRLKGSVPCRESDEWPEKVFAKMNLVDLFRCCGNRKRLELKSGSWEQAVVAGLFSRVGLRVP